MKLRHLSLLSTLVLAYATFNAGETNFKYCLFAGYYGPNSFIGGLAQKLASRDGLIGSSVCSASWKQGNEIGERALRGQANSKEDLQVMMEAGKFSDRVYDFIIMGLKL